MPTNVNAVLREVAARMRSNSERWFPQIHDGSVDLITFYALGLSGEAGEVSNDAKKRLRDHGDFDREHMAEELADTFTYLLLLADEMGVDLVSEYERKAAHNEVRFG